jgi:phosphopantothenoylcysteine synthetase/decarboxylase
MEDLAGKHIVLGLSGGIACYKAAELCRALIKAGATVQVVMTQAAEHFITPTTMQALSGRTVYTRPMGRARSQQHAAYQFVARGRLYLDSTCLGRLY